MSRPKKLFAIGASSPALRVGAGKRVDARAPTGPCLEGRDADAPIRAGTPGLVVSVVRM